MKSESSISYLMTSDISMLWYVKFPVETLQYTFSIYPEKLKLISYFLLC